MDEDNDFWMELITNPQDIYVYTDNGRPMADERIDILYWVHHIDNADIGRVKNHEENAEILGGKDNPVNKADTTDARKEAIKCENDHGEQVTIEEGGGEPHDLETACTSSSRGREGSFPFAGLLCDFLVVFHLSCLAKEGQMENNEKVTEKTREELGWPKMYRRQKAQREILDVHQHS